MNRLWGVLAVTGAILVATWWLKPPCLLGCDTVFTGDQAARNVEIALDAELPEGVTVPAMLIGGFQDRFVQIRLETPPEILPQVLTLFSADVDALNDAETVTMTASAADWWDVDARRDLRVTDGELEAFTFVGIAVANNRSQGGLTVYVFASQS